MNSKGYLFISLAKSGIRIIGGCLSVAYSSINLLAISIVLAEGLGILEELVDKR